MQRTCLTVLAAGLLAAATTVQAQQVQVEAKAQVVQPQVDEMGFYRTSELIGMPVRAQDGQELGQIQDLMVDSRTQQIRYFVLSTGEKVTANSKLRVMPWTIARPQFAQENRHVVVQMEPERLRQAPVFTQQQIWAPQPVWVEDVNRFYGVRQRVARPDFDVEVDDNEIEIERDDD